MQAIVHPRTTKCISCKLPSQQSQLISHHHQYRHFRDTSKIPMKDTIPRSVAYTPRVMVLIFGASDSLGFFT